jgi:PhnB protein
MQIQPYLSFNGRCEEAIEFYRKALGATVETMMRFKESPDPMPPGMLAPGFENKVMHATLRIGGAVLMASDGMAAGALDFKGFSLSIDAADAAGADRMFNALAVGGKVTMPLAKTFWSPYFGMVTDRFGVGWMVSTAPQ